MRAGGAPSGAPTPPPRAIDVGAAVRARPPVLTQGIEEIRVHPQGVDRHNPVTLELRQILGHGLARIVQAVRVRADYHADMAMGGDQPRNDDPRADIDPFHPGGRLDRIPRPHGRDAPVPDHQPRVVDHRGSVEQPVRVHDDVLSHGRAGDGATGEQGGGGNGAKRSGHGEDPRGFGRRRT